MDKEARSFKDIKLNSRPYLIIRKKEGETQISLESDSYTLGRENADIIINKKSVSRKHAELKENWGGYIIRDMNSHNGTFINNYPIKQEYQLQHSDIIRLGQTNDTDPITIEFCNPLGSAFNNNIKNKNAPAEVQQGKLEEPYAEINPSLVAELKDIKSPLGLGKRGGTKSKPLTNILLLLLIITIIIGLIYIIRTTILPDAHNMRISVINPRAQHPGGNLKIIGENFSLDMSRYKILFREFEGSIMSISSNEIIVQIPKRTEPGAITPKILFDGYDIKAPTITILQNPTIISVNPDSIYPGDELCITGQNFSSLGPENIVTILGKEALVISATEKEIRIIVPEFELLKTEKEIRAQLFVKSNLLASNSFEILIKRKPIAYIDHAFYVEGAGSEENPYKLIQNQVISILAINNKGDYADEAERIKSIIQNLNDFLSNYPQTLDVSYTKDSIDLIVNNKTEYSIRINPEDVLLYQELNPNTAINSAKLSKWITAVLKDYISTFISNEPPIHTVSSSHSGRVLMYIYENYNKKTSPFTGVTDHYLNSLKQEYLTFLMEMGITIPEGYSELTGYYSGRASDNFLSKSISAGYISLELKILSSGSSLKIAQKMSLDRSDDTGGFSQQASRSIGTFSVDKLDIFEPYISFSITMEGNIIKFSGEIFENGIQGTFIKANKQTGRFVLTR